VDASLTLLWIAAGASLVAALAAWSKARRTARRLEQISQMYWELKYQHGELRAQVQRLTSSGQAPSSPAPAAPGQPADSFVPLASLKR
jgi:hypothetical protein